MSVLEYIILAFALAFPVMATVRGCALKHHIRLTRGLAVSALLAAVHVAFILMGISVANLLRRWGTVLLLGIATAVNTLLVGLGLGFRVSLQAELWKLSVPLFVVLFLLCYWGIMLGRRNKPMRERRWLLIAVLFLLIFAVKGAFFGE